MSGNGFAQQASTFVYTETNNSTPGENAVVAYLRDGKGQFTEIGSYNTAGTGIADALGLLGPIDTDKEVVASPDGRNLYAVNTGSGTIAAFQVNSDGSLDLIGHSAISSGGTEPVSLSFSGRRLYVLNRGDEIQGQTGSIAPTITTFDISRNGSLQENFADTVSLPVGTSPSQILIDPTGHLLFVDTFTPPSSGLPTPAEANEIVPYQIAANGALTPTPSGGLGDSVSPPLLLGLAFDPNQNIIYAGLTGANKVGVFTFDSAGDLALVSTIPVQGSGPCWATVSANGQYLYTSDTGSDSVGVFSLANPYQPVQIQEFTLGGPQYPAGSTSTTLETANLEFALDPSGKTLYVLNHDKEINGSFPQGNALHIVSIAGDGTLSENANSPVYYANLPVGDAPQGVAAIAAPAAPPQKSFTDFETSWAIDLFEQFLSYEQQNNEWYHASSGSDDTN